LPAIPFGVDGEQSGGHFARFRRVVHALVGLLVSDAGVVCADCPGGGVNY
jgi:hypothetical protein